jgi:hypothetical protein
MLNVRINSVPAYICIRNIQFIFILGQLGLLVVPLPPPLAVDGEYDDLLFSLDGSMINQQSLRFACMYLGFGIPVSY